MAALKAKRVDTFVSGEFRQLSQKQFMQEKFKQRWSYATSPERSRGLG
jgi:hypothetical protein